MSFWLASSRHRRGWHVAARSGPAVKLKGSGDHQAPHSGSRVCVVVPYDHVHSSSPNMWSCDLCCRCCCCCCCWSSLLLHAVAAAACCCCLLSVACCCCLLSVACCCWVGTPITEPVRCTREKSQLLPCTWCNRVLVHGWGAGQSPAEKILAVSGGFKRAS